MGIVRWKVEVQHRYPSVETGLDYYWTSVYYYNNHNSDPAAGASYAAILNTTYDASYYSNQIVAVRISNVETGTPYGIATPLDNHGNIPDTEPGSLTNVIRLIGRAGGRVASYHLWRAPLTIADIDGSQLADAMWAIVNDVILPGLAEASLMNVNGVEIEEWAADRAIHIWQLRHGTKRRERVVFAYP